MVITLDNNFNIVNTSDEMIVQGSNLANQIELVIPKTAVNNLFPSATFMRADGRTFGPLIATTTTNDDTNYHYVWELDNKLLAVSGVMQITFTINFENDSNQVVKTKNVSLVYFEIYEAVISGDVILVGGEEAVENILSQIEALQATIANNSIKIADNTNEINKIKQAYIKSVAYDATTYKFSYTLQDDSVVTYDLPIESLVDDVEYKDHIITFTMADQKTKYNVDLNELYHPIVEAKWDGVSDTFSLGAENSTLSNENTIFKVIVGEAGNSFIMAKFMANEADKLIYTGTITKDNVVKNVFFVISNKKDIVVKYEYSTIPTITANVETLEPENNASVEVETSQDKSNVALNFGIPKGYDGYGVLSLNIDDNGDLIMRTDGIDGQKFSINGGDLIYSFGELNRMLLAQQIKAKNNKIRW